MANAVYNCVIKENKFMTLFNACAEFCGKEKFDNQLSALSEYFNGFLKSDKDGKRFLKRYERVAPYLVERINSSEMKQEFYRYISGFLSSCTELISLGENQRCLNELKFMLKNLKKAL